MTKHDAIVDQPRPLDVYLTVDVEVWCDGWSDIDSKFPASFRQYIHGSTPRGDYGLPYQLKVLRDHGLRASFFVEPLFSARFGPDALAEIVGLLSQADQDVQLHLHTEWVDEARAPLLAGFTPEVTHKRQFLRMFSLDEQRVLIGVAARLLVGAGAAAPRAFRAGSFGFNAESLTAAHDNAIAIDASYNATMFGPDSGLAPGRLLTDACAFGPMVELPMTVFRDGLGRLRHVQLTACSWSEIEALLWQAMRSGQRSFVILSHGSELLDHSRRRPDDTVVSRFDRLCTFLARHRDSFRLRCFDDGEAPRLAVTQPRPLRGALLPTVGRVAQQLARRGRVWMAA